MRIGVQFQTHGVAPNHFREATEQAITLGVDSVFLWDHLVPFTGTSADSAWESWSLLGSMGPSVRGTDVTLGILVSPLTFRRPAILARAAATVATLGNGQFILGVGVGGFDLDDVLAETEMTTAERIDRFRTGLRRVVDEVRRQEELHGVDIRVWVGGDGLRVSIPSAAAMADGWSGFGPPERFARAMEALTTSLAKAADGTSDESAATRKGGKPKFECSVLLTPLDEPMDLGAYRDAHHVVRSLRPEPEGSFDLTPIVTLLTQRANLVRDDHR